MKSVLSAIIEAGGQQGLTTKAIAERAGVAPETVSRMRSRGSGDFAIVARLADVVGLKLGVMPRNELTESILRGEFF